MNYLSVELLTLTFGARRIFEDLSFGIDKGEKVGLVARNGSGKTSLLNAIMGLEPVNSGKVTFRNGITLGYLAQKEEFDPDLTVLETVFRGDSNQMKAIRNYEALLDEGLENDAFYKALAEMERTQAWSVESKAKEILYKFGLENLDKRVGDLSGGQQKRLGLSLELIKDPDLLIMDEPTNHLDLEMTEWLESHLNTSNSTILMVTHDRYFLDSVCNVIIELEDNTLYRHRGNYSYFLEKKQEREENISTVVSKAKSAMRKELDWIRRQPKARGTKAKYRVQAFDELKKTATKNLSKDELQIEINVPRIGSKVVELHKISKGFEEKELISGFSYIFLRKDRIGIVGKNGTGKSTLLNLITGTLTPDKGKVVIGDTVQFGYFTQSGLQFKDGQRVKEAVSEIADVIPLTRGQKISASQLLERFMFPRSMHFNLISSLSGGEKRRLHLLRVLMNNPNFLILDEPTNDLDVYTLQILEDYLEDFPGVILVVSHDRHFMDRIVDHTFAFEGKAIIKDYPGNYSQYRAYKELQDEEEKQRSAKNAVSDQVIKPDSIQTEKVKMTYAERLEYEALEEEIDQLENKVKEINDKIMNINDAEKLQVLTKEIGDTQKELENKTDRWLHLAQFED
ncbi:MAG: ABC-F family ATP-binding cassette domain-containing protein [Flavobacteriales bacterium]|nr:ABC-F family ATP-binding cassette domain-containing protein [Flavobacteriales bacterium]